MPNQVQSGTMLVQQSAILGFPGVPSELYCQNWRSLGALESFGFDQTVRAAGWNLFFMAEELRAVVPAWGGQSALHRGVKRLLAQTRLQHFNCLELSHVLRKYFLGIPYISIVAHPRHMQRGYQIQPIERRAQDNTAGSLQQRPSAGSILEVAAAAHVCWGDEVLHATSDGPMRMSELRP
jgi:hypothetical protein